MNTEMLIVGGDGDLAIRKLYPALFALEQDGQLSNVARICGIARHPKDREDVLSAIRAKLEDSERFNEQCWKTFSDRLDMLHGDATQADDLSAYRDSIDFEKTQLTIYLAIPPKVFSGVVKALGRGWVGQTQHARGGGKAIGNRQKIVSCAAKYHRRSVRRIPGLSDRPLLG